MLKVGFVGGPNVGKTSLMRRLAGRPFEVSHVQYPGIIAELMFAVEGSGLTSFGLSSQNFILDTLSSSSASIHSNVTQDLSSIPLETDNIDVLVYDFDGQSLGESAVESALSQCAAVVVVIDCSDITSLQYADKWVEYLDSVVFQSHKKFLVVNKADSEVKVITPENLSIFARSEGFLSWAYTVGHFSLGDIDISREEYHRQIPIELFLKTIVNEVFKPSKSSPFHIKNLVFRSWKNVDYASFTVPNT